MMLMLTRFFTVQNADFTFNMGRYVCTWISHLIQFMGTLWWGQMMVKGWVTWAKYNAWSRRIIWYNYLCGKKNPVVCFFVFSGNSPVLTSTKSESESPWTPWTMDDLGDMGSVPQLPEDPRGFFPCSPRILSGVTRTTSRHSCPLPPFSWPQVVTWLVHKKEQFWWYEKPRV